MTTRAAALLLSIAFAAITVAGLWFTAVRAVAVFQELTETGESGYLRLAVDSSTPLQAELGPGESMRWLIEASLDDADESTLAVDLLGRGDLVEAASMTAAVEACAGGVFSLSEGSAACDGVYASVLPTTPLAAVSHRGERYTLADLHADEPRQLLVTITLPADTPKENLAGGSAQIRLGVHAAGDSPPGTPLPPPSDRIALTGADTLALALLGSGLLGLGVIVLHRGRKARGTVQDR